jgi:hypothetical protein
MTLRYSERKLTAFFLPAEKAFYNKDIITLKSMNNFFELSTVPSVLISLQPILGYQKNHIKWLEKS